MKLPLLVLLLLTLLLTGRPASAQTLNTPPAADSLALRVAAHTEYLTDAMRLSPRQRREVAALLTQQLRHPECPVPAMAWLKVLCLHQYQAWQLVSGPFFSRMQPCAEAPETEVALARRAH